MNTQHQDGRYEMAGRLLAVSQDPALELDERVVLRELASWVSEHGPVAGRGWIAGAWFAKGVPAHRVLWLAERVVGVAVGLGGAYPDLDPGRPMQVDSPEVPPQRRNAPAARVGLLIEVPEPLSVEDISGTLEVAAELFRQSLREETGFDIPVTIEA